MPSDREFHLPEFYESSIAAVHLLQGGVDHDEGRIWNLVLSHQTRKPSSSPPTDNTNSCSNNILRSRHKNI